MPAGSTYTPIATTTLGSAVSSYTFSSIPSTYTDLLIVGNGKLASDSTLAIRFNGDTGSNYSQTVLYGDGSSSASYRESNQSSQNFALWDTVQSSFNLQLQNYANTNIYKTTLVRYGRTTSVIGASVVLWRSNAAINSVTITGGSNLQIGTTFTLYGIAAA